MSSLQIIALVGFAAICTWASISDIRHRKIPNAAAGLLALCGIVVMLTDGLVASPISALLGGVLCIVIMELADFITNRISSRRPQLGGGDVKLAGALGLWLGWNLVPVFILIASLLFLLQNFFFRRISHESPMAPSLCLSATSIIFWVLLFS